MDTISEQIRADEILIMESWQGENFTYKGKDFVIQEGVYIPREASHLLAEHLTINPNDYVLDLGTGSGFLAIIAAYYGAEKVIALDINPKAIQNAKYNVAQHKLEAVIELRLSDMFQALHPNEMFDVMVVNLPFVSHPANQLIERALWDPDFVAHRTFFQQFKRYLKPKGRIYLLQANFGEVDWVKLLAHEAGLHITQLGQVNVPFIDDYQLEFYLFQLQYT